MAGEKDKLSAAREGRANTFLNIIQKRMVSNKSKAIDEITEEFGFTKRLVVRSAAASPAPPNIPRATPLTRLPPPPRECPLCHAPRPFHTLPSPLCP